MLYGWVRGWCRYWFNRTPIEGQEWTLDGVGRVLIVKVLVGTLKYRFQGETQVVFLSDFRSQATLWAPRSLEDVLR